MTAFPFSLSSGSGIATVTAFNVNSTAPIYQADERHPHWVNILQGLETGDANVWTLFDVAEGVMSKFKQVSERVSFDGENVLFDGDPIHSVLADQLKRAIEDGNADNYTALAKFWEKLASNPEQHSREQAYNWLASHKFQITQDGDVVGYKGMTLVRTEEDGTEVYESYAASQAYGLPSAFVNGEAVTPMSRVPQSIGDVVTMPRSEVVHDPRHSCSRGLHVATHNYASSYGVVMEVHVNPRDICSVPTGGQKVRVNRYKNERLALDPDNQNPGPVLRDEAPKYAWAGDVSYKVD